jgi:hypothetical protein
MGAVPQSIRIARGRRAESRRIWRRKRDSFSLKTLNPRKLLAFQLAELAEFAETDSFTSFHLQTRYSDSLHLPRSPRLQFYLVRKWVRFGESATFTHRADAPKGVRLRPWRCSSTAITLRVFAEVSSGVNISRSSSGRCAAGPEVHPVPGSRNSANARPNPATRFRSKGYYGRQRHRASESNRITACFPNPPPSAVAM